jgi:hypothetical protein
VQDTEREPYEPIRVLKRWVLAYVGFQMLGFGVKGVQDMKKEPYEPIRVRKRWVWAVGALFRSVGRVLINHVLYSYNPREPGMQIDFLLEVISTGGRQEGRRIFRLCRVLKVQGSGIVRLYRVTLGFQGLPSFLSAILSLL